MITLPPFKSFLASNIPSVYDNTLSYYDELTKLIAYLEQVVVPAVNESTADIDAVKTGLKELKEYVDHYFDNLDIQEEIDKKLDEMAEGGQLAGIIAQFLEIAPVFAYKTISDMSSATNLSNGCIARVIGNSDATNGDGAYYLVRTKTGGDVPDGLNLVAVGETLVAERVISLESTQIASLDTTLNEECKINFIYRGADGGSSRLIRVNGKNVLFDFGIGNYTTNLINYLKNKSISKLDYVIISHYHSDHVGGDSAEGVLALLNDSYFDFADTVFVLPHKGIDWSEFYNYSDDHAMQTAEGVIKNALTTAGISYIEPDDGDEITLSPVTKIKFNNIGSSYYTHYYAAGLYNNFSMLVTLTHNKTKALITSDCEELAQQYNINNVDYADIVTAPHHDLNPYSNENFLRKLNSKYEIIETLFDQQTNPLLNNLGVSTMISGYLRSIGCKVFNANQSGEIEVTITNNDIVVVADNGCDTLQSNLATLGGGKALTAGSDLNGLKQVGSYYAIGSIANTILNLPVGFSDPGPFRVTNTQIHPYSGQLVQTFQTPRTVLMRQLRNATDWSDWSEVFEYGLGLIPNKIAANSDVNNYTEPGKYFIENGTDYASIAHLPSEFGGGSNSLLFVMRGRAEYDTLRQVLFTGNNIYFRSGISSNRWSNAPAYMTWNKWKIVDASEVDYQ